MTFLDFCHNAVGWIHTNQTVTYSRSENRVKNGVDDLHAVRFESDIFDQMDIELLDIAVSDRSNIPQSEAFGYVLLVHILVVGTCGLFQLIFGFYVRIEKAVQRGSVGSIGIYAVFQITLYLFLHLTQRFCTYLPCWCFIGIYQFPAVNASGFAFDISVTIFVSAVLPLAFSCSEYSSFMVSFSI